MQLRGLKILRGLTAALVVATAAQAAGPNTPLFPDDRTLGNPKAPVVVVEYAAPICPHCAHFAKDVLPQLKSAYVDTGKVYYVFRIFPLADLDGAVAGMAKCAAPGKYFEFIDLAFRRQDLWDPDGNQIADVHAGLIALGKLAGYTPEKTDRCMKDQAELDRVNRMGEDAVAHYHVNSTPTLVVNGEVVTGAAIAWPALKTRIDAILAKKH